MGRLRKDYLTRQRSTPFQCLAHTFMHSHYLLGRGLLLGGGERKEPFCDRGDLSLCHHIAAWAKPTLGSTHIQYVLTPSCRPFPLKQEDSPITSAQGVTVSFFGRPSDPSLCC